MQINVETPEEARVIYEALARYKADCLRAGEQGQASGVAMADIQMILDRAVLADRLSHQVEIPLDAPLPVGSVPE